MNGSHYAEGIKLYASFFFPFSFPLYDRKYTGMIKLLYIHL